MIKLLVLSLFAGLIYVFSFSPFDHNLTTFVSIIIFFYALQKSPTIKLSFFIGWLYGIGLYGGGIHWVYYSISTFGEEIAPIAGVLTFVFIITLGLVYAVFALFYFYINKKITANYDYLLLPLLWFWFEILRSWIFTGFPWVLAGSGQIDGFLKSYLPVVGVYGVSFIIAFLSYVILSLLLPIIKKEYNFFYCIQTKVLVFFSVIILLFAWGLNDISWTQKDNKTLNAAIIQANIKQEIKFSKERLKNSLDIYTKMSMEQPQEIELVVWPETAIATFYHRKKDHLKNLQQKLSPITIISGIFTKNKNNGEYYNSAIKLSHPVQTYSKEQLVPFGEYMPLKEIFDFFKKYINIPMSNLRPHSKNQKPIYVKGIAIDMSICYESAYTLDLYQRVSGRSLMINISNDAWFGDSIAPAQHLQIARTRAKEYGRQMIRSTNNGISAFIDEKGKIIKKTSQFKKQTISNKMQTFRGQTPFMKFGIMPMYALSILFLLLLTLNLFRNKDMA
ncbi:MAG: apolipoprotein N-acyltransferase [Gammaproteobacteria bacterium]|nr:MAG: apolipoprotein N-acyltransferase [Gammaproteobacteria bacterium]